MVASVPVVLYFYRLGGEGGGAERMICQLAGALVRRGFEVHLVSWDNKDTSTFYPIDAKVHWHRLGFHPSYTDKLRRIYTLYGVLKRHSIKVLVGFVMSGDRTVYAAAKMAGVKLVAAERNAPDMYRFRCGAIQRWAAFQFLRLADRITVQLESYIIGYPHILHNRIISIPNPVPIAQSHAKPGTPNISGRYVLLAVSRLESMQKNIGCLISAFSHLADRFPAWDVYIIGDGSERETLLSQIHNFGLTDRIHIMSSTSHIFDFYTQSHLFAIPSRWEGFSNSLAEAMSHGLPAVGFERAAGVADLIEDGGWLAAGLDDEKSLAVVLGSAMADDAERARRGQLAIQRMAQFEPERQFNQWAKLLHSLSPRKPS